MHVIIVITSCLRRRSCIQAQVGVPLSAPFPACRMEAGGDSDVHLNCAGTGRMAKRPAAAPQLPVAKRPAAASTGPVAKRPAAAPCSSSQGADHASDDDDSVMRMWHRDPSDADHASDDDDHSESAFGGMRLAGEKCVQYSDGPAKYEEIMALPSEKLLANLNMIFPTLATNFSAHLQKRVWCSSSYSGMGCFEAVTRPLTDAAHGFAGCSGPGVGLVPWSASDISKIPRQALLSHSKDTRAKHIFGDILERISEPWRSLAVKKQAKTIDQYARLQQKHKGDADYDLLGKKKQLGDDMVKALSSLLSQAEWEETGHCYACCQRCPYKPPMQDGDEWLECAGVTCIAWSSMGATGGWLHESTLPCLTWMHWLLQSDVSFALIECVRGFDYTQALATLLPVFSGFSNIFSPSQLGIPSVRVRCYTWLWRKSRFHCQVEQPVQVFGEAFLREQVADSSIYMIATKDTIRSSRLSELASRSLPLADLDSQDNLDFDEMSGSAVLKPAMWQRYLEYRKLAKAKMEKLAKAKMEHAKMEHNTAGEVTGIVDLNQTAGYQKSVANGRVGALLRKSKLYDLAASSDRLLCVYPEYFAIMGWPLGDTELTKKYAPWGMNYEGLVDEMSEEALRALLGNSMHLVAVSSMVLFGMACIQHK
jgi:hypothetical protein